VRLRA